ncbi:MAG: class I SAM-dependent methyltransferase [Candidatus Alkanophagales archaeon]
MDEKGVARRLIIKFYSEKAPNYAALADAHPGFRELREKVRGMLSPSSGARVLDLGAGTCHHGLSFAHCEVLCLDISREMLKTALLTRRGAAGVHVVVGDIEKLPIKDGSIDVAICVNALRYVDAEALIKEAKRVLKPRGEMLLVDGDKDRIRAAGLEETVKKHELERTLLERGLIRIYSCEELRGLLESHGCVVEAAEHFRIYFLLKASVPTSASASA